MHIYPDSFVFVLHKIIWIMTGIIDCLKDFILQQSNSLLLYPLTFFVIFKISSWFLLFFFSYSIHSLCAPVHVFPLLLYTKSSYESYFPCLHIGTCFHARSILVYPW